MGCDIHWYSEKRNTEGNWVCQQAESFGIEDGYEGEYPTMDSFIVTPRSYSLFGLLNSGVRTTWPWSFPYQNELPTDVSETIRQLHEYWDGDAHSTSALTLAQLLTKREELATISRNLLIDPFPGIQSSDVKYLIEELDRVIEGFGPTIEPEDSRVIFWFDN